MLYNIFYNLQLSQNPISTIGTLVLLNGVKENEASKLTSLVLEVTYILATGL